jgi:hypothetical protein
LNLDETRDDRRGQPLTARPALVGAAIGGFTVLWGWVQFARHVRICWLTT